MTNYGLLHQLEFPFTGYHQFAYRPRMDTILLKFAHFEILFASLTVLWVLNPSCAAPILGSTIDLTGVTSVAMRGPQPQLTAAQLKHLELTSVRTMSLLAKCPYEFVLADTPFRPPSQSDIQIQSLATEGSPVEFEVRHAMWGLHLCREGLFYMRVGFVIECSIYLEATQARQVLSVGSLHYKRLDDISVGFDNASLAHGVEGGSLPALQSRRLALSSRTELNQADESDVPALVYNRDSNTQLGHLDNNSSVSARPTLSVPQAGITLSNFGPTMVERFFFEAAWGAIMDRAAKEPRQELIGAYRSRPLRIPGPKVPEIEYHPLTGTWLKYNTVVEALSLIPQLTINLGQGWRECAFTIYEVEDGRGRKVGGGYLRMMPASANDSPESAHNMSSIDAIL